MKISELKPKQPNVEIEGNVKNLSEEKSFDKGGRQLRLVKALIGDDSGDIELTLWNDDIDKVKEGDKIKIKNGYVKEYQGEKQLTTGRNGEMEVVESGDSSGGSGDSGEGGSEDKSGEKEVSDSDEESEDKGKIEPEVEKI